MPPLTLVQLVTALFGDSPMRWPLLLMLGKATALLLLALAGAYALRRASAGARHLVWMVVLGGLLALPALAVWSPLALRILPAETAAITPPAPTGAESATTGAPTTVTADPSFVGTGAPFGEPSSPSWFASLETGEWLLLAWAVVAALLIGRLGLGLIAVRRIVRRAEVLDTPEWQHPLYEIADRLGIETAPVLLRSRDIHMPFASGLTRGTIVLPAECEEWTAEQRTAVLIHELGHVRRRDLVGHTLGRVVCALWWFHPLAWTAARRLRDESERACDDLALAFGAKPSEYAEHLLDIVTAVRNHATPSVALAMAHRKEFEGRMLAILDPELERRTPRRWQRASLVGTFAVLAVVIGAVAPVPRAAAQDDRGADRRAAHDRPLAPETPLSNVAPLPATTPKAAVLPSLVDGRVALEESQDSLSTETRRLDRRRTDLINRRTNQAISTVLNGRVPAGAAAVTGDDRPDLLAKILRTDSSASVRRIAAWGLFPHADKAVAVEALAAALRGDRDADVRTMAAWALQGADGDAPLRELRAALRNDRDDEVREMAVWALVQHGDESSADAIAAILDRDASPTLKGTAAWALGTLGTAKKAPRGLVAMLQEPSRDARLKAAWALSEIRDPATLPALRKALDTENDMNVKRALMRGAIAAGASTESLTALLDAKDPEIRELAIRAIAGGGSSWPWPWPWPRPKPMP